MNWDRGLPGAFRDVARWFNERRSPYVATRALRELLPGDPQFGDPMSTTGTEPARRLARRAWALNEGRLSLAAELGLAALQVADWLRDDAGSRDGEGEVCILFTDLVGFSSWALTAGDAQSLDLLRRVDAEVTAVVEASGGEVVKRLGDGTMAVFPGDPAAAVKAACTALEAASEVYADGYKAKLRAGLHRGTPRAIGSDYIGVDVNIAARLCEAARGNEVLVSEAVRDRLDGSAPPPEWRQRRDLRGVPKRLETYSIRVGNGRQ